MVSDTLNLRPMAESDWPRVFEIIRAVVSEGETYVYPDGLSADEARRLWLEDPPGQTIVAVQGDELLGTAKFGPNRPGRGGHISTASFMVPASGRGRGVGRAMCEFAIAWAKENDYRGMQFNAVVSTNLNAIALYHHLGFTTIGTVPGAFDHVTLGPVGLDIMYLEF